MSSDSSGDASFYESYGDSDVYEEDSENYSSEPRSYCDNSGMPPLCTEYTHPEMPSGCIGATQHIIDPNKPCNHEDNPLHAAVIENNLETVENLLKQPNNDVNYRSCVTALYLSLQMLRSDSFVIRLIEAGCDPNVRTVNEDAPLHIAVQRATTDVALKLIAKGADVNAMDRFKRTPLHYAVLSNNLLSVCMLLYYRAQVDVADLRGEMPIQIALRYESVDIISALCNCYESSALLVLITSERPTPVHLKLAYYLVKAGANVNYIDRNGNNPIGITLYDDNPLLFKLIWSKLDHAVLLECGMPLLSNYIRNCIFSPSQWLECLYLILESPVAIDLIKHTRKFGSVFLELLHAFDYKKIERNDTIAIIYMFLNLETEISQDCFKVAYNNYGFNEELEAIIYCGKHSTNLIEYDLMDFLLPYIILAVKEEPSAEDIFNWIKNRIELSAVYLDIEETVMIKEIVYTLGFFSLPVNMKVELLELFQETFGSCKEISDILGAEAKVPSLHELCRNQTRKLIRASFKIERPYQFYDIMKKLNLPQIIYDIICFKKAIY